MTYLSTDAAHLDTIIGLWATVIIVSAIVAFIIRKKKPKTEPGTVDFVVTDPTTGSMSLSKKLLIVPAFVVAGMIASFVYTGNAEAKIKENFVSNLKAKYDISEINSKLDGYPGKNEAGKSGTVFAGYFRGQVINVTAGGENHDFVVVQDAVTFEPTLYDLPEDMKSIREKGFENPDSYMAESFEK